MAEVRLTAMDSNGSSYHGVTIDDHDECKGIKVIWLHIGQDTVRIWPADPEKIEDLGKKLIAAAKKLRKYLNKR
jgi:hypothetical protein